MATPLDFEVYGNNNAALFNLKIFRGEGMALLGMNWKSGPPPINFVGFCIEYKEPNGGQFYAVSNRLSFPGIDRKANPNNKSSRFSPIQKFRWIHFPYHPGLKGNYTYRVSPVFMDGKGVLSYGDYQEADIQLENETYPGMLNIAFTRGFIGSQAFEDRFRDGNDQHSLLPSAKDDRHTFVSENPQAQQAYAWLGLQARKIILDLLDAAIADPTAKVVVTAYDLDEKEVVDKLEKLGERLRIIIDSSDKHGLPGSYETRAEERLIKSAGAENVQRQKAGGLQHNKYIAVAGSVQQAVGGSTNFSWRGFFVQNNNAVLVHGRDQVEVFFAAFEKLWKNKEQSGIFADSISAGWNDLNLPGVEGSITFSPHSDNNACLKKIADDISTTTSSLMFSLAFLYQTKGVILDSVTNVTKNNKMFVYGISDKEVDGLDLKIPEGNRPVAFPANLPGGVVEGFDEEGSIGSGIRMHHKFVVIDFDKPEAMVYTGSYNFSLAADNDNGENLWRFRDRRIAVAYMIEAVSMFDHYEWRDAVKKAKEINIRLNLAVPPADPGRKTWWAEDYTTPQKIRDRELFSKQFITN
jgi:phosphatidylserine/phosphatidylglycerophosphate/cardiolipin synthase-like enzyme